MSEQAKALRLAELLDEERESREAAYGFHYEHLALASAELRRLHSVSAELLEALQEAVVALKHVQNALYVRVNPGTVEKGEAAISRALGQ